MLDYVAYGFSKKDEVTSQTFRPIYPDYFLHCRTILKTFNIRDIFTFHSLDISTRGSCWHPDQLHEPVTWNAFQSEGPRQNDSKLIKLTN